MAPHAILDYEDGRSGMLPLPIKPSAQNGSTQSPRAAPDSLKVVGVSDTNAAVVPDPIIEEQPLRPRFSPDDVVPHRQSTQTPFSRSVAAFSSAHMFKSKIALSRPVASRSFYDTHLSEEAKARKPSSLKGAMKYLKPGTISLCGGLPSSEYFPYEKISFNVPHAPDFSSTTTSLATAGKYDTNTGTSDYDLQVALNYGQCMGPPQLMRFLTEHTEIVHDMPYSDWEICLTQGSTSALDLSLRMLCQRGDSILTEEYSFSSAIESFIPMGIRPVGIKVDAEGLCPKNLDYVLSNWTDGAKLSAGKYDGARKPKILYTVPTGQNPTGATQGTQRRKDILAVCEKHDIFVLEDEPYYFLQMEKYVSQRSACDSEASASRSSSPDDLKTFLANLTPSYLHLDTSGRVLRMDSFSKTLAPGCRTGWVTGPANLVERFVRASGLSAQNPSGFSMIAIYKLLEEQWGHHGFLQWLQILRAEYSSRRDIIVEACEKYLPRDIVSWTPPMAGMFHWLQLDGSKHPLHRAGQAFCSSEAVHRALLETIEEQIFVTGTRHDVLIARGSWFRAEKGGHEAEKDRLNSATASPCTRDTTICFRMTFAAASPENIVQAVKRFGDALREEFLQQE